MSLTKTGYEPLWTLKPAGPEIWVVDGPLVRFYGMPFPTRMTVIRLESGALWVHSPIAPDPGLEVDLAALGPVAALVAPNWIHYVHLPAWQVRYPGAQTWIAPGVVERAAAMGLTIQGASALTSGAPAAWSGQISALLVPGSAVHQEIVFFHHRSRTLVLTDLIENFEPAKLPRWARPLVWLAGTRDPDGKAPLDMRLSFRLRRGGMAALRAALAQILEWAPERVIVAHGRWYRENGASELRRAFRWAIASSSKQP